MTMPADDDRWVLEDGRTIVVVNGVVESIEGGSIESEDEDLADAPAAQALTAEEVSGMIDARFADIMEEITRMKSMMDDKKEEMNSFKTEVNEKFSSVPALGSIKKPEIVRPLDTKFSETEARIKEFARTLKK
jgi:hypothetical protein